MVCFPALLAATFVWCHCAGEETTPRTSGGRMISTREVEAPKTCDKDSDCGDAELLSCDLELKLCKCRDKYSVLSSAVKCLPSKHLGEECEEGIQCQLLDMNATCTEDKFCDCDLGFYKLLENNGTLCIGGSEEVVSADVDIKMIITVGVIVIMFIGICAALQMFSKARLWTRRTIFNSLHPSILNMKFGRRKSSNASRQHIPMPPSSASRHSFSGQKTPSPIDKERKSRSHECLSEQSRPSSPGYESRPKLEAFPEKQYLPPNEELKKETPEPLQNGLPSAEESQAKDPDSPSVIITNANGTHTVTMDTRSPSPRPGANV